ncbi:MAG: fructokinase [Saprospiraceae bacterium]|jgi:fructokinase
MRYKWGIDLGGTKIEGVILDAENNNETVARLRLPTEQQKGYQHILSQIHGVILNLQKETGIKPTHIGMGTPGVIDPTTNKMKNSNTLCLIGKTLRTDIEELSGCEFRTSNDANCFAVAETLMGVVADLDPKPQVVFGVIMGTGVGGGLVIGGNVINGRHGIAGEWGHNVLDPNGVDCYCGKTGCVEKVIAGPSLERYYEEISGVRKSLKDISIAHQNGEDSLATQTVNYMVDNFGKAISCILNTIDPDVVILGGGVGNIPDLLDKAVEATTPYIFNDKVETTFLKPKLGDSAGVFGAALLW